MNGNQMDTTNPNVLTRLSVKFNTGILLTNLSGIQYFKSLRYLLCNQASLTSIPSLPASLDTLILQQNPLAALPALPDNLTYLICSSDQLTSLPANLPNTLTYLDCSYNPLYNLPALPSNLLMLRCYGDSLTGLPALPSTLTYLSCGYNHSLTSLPTLPNSITTIDCSHGVLTSLPALPTSLVDLYCENNKLTSLPTLPSSLSGLVCSSNKLTSIPVLPDSLTELLCNFNLLTSLPSLPSTLTYFYCGNNNITCFPLLPQNVWLDSTEFEITPNPFTCLPNYTTGMTHAVLQTPLCTLGNVNGCTSYIPIASFSLTPDTAPYTWDAYPTYSSNINNAKWYWGDGTFTFGLYPSHTYSVASRYNICVTAYTPYGDTSQYCQSDTVYRLAYYSSPLSTMIRINVLSSVKSTSSASSVCKGDSTTLTASGATTYSWAPSTGLSSTTGSMVIASPTVTTTYTVTGITGGTMNLTIITVTVLPMPMPVAICNTPCVNQILHLSCTPNGFASYSWVGPNSFSTSIQNPQINSVVGATAGVYSVTVIDANACTNSATVTVSINPLPIVTVNSPTVCFGQTINLTCLPNGGSSYSWSGLGGMFTSNLQNPSIANATAAMSGNYAVTVTDANGCVNGNLAEVVINPLPTIAINASSGFCIGDTITLTALGATTYTWNTGATTPSISVTPTSSVTMYSYTVTGADGNECSDTASITGSLIIDCTGIQKFASNNEQVNIYPNPNNGSFVIESQNTLYNVHCTIYDVNGKLVLSQTINCKTTIDASSLAEGVYNISLQSNEGVVNKRLVIVK